MSTNDLKTNRHWLEAFLTKSNFDFIGSLMWFAVQWKRSAAKLKLFYRNIKEILERAVWEDNGVCVYVWTIKNKALNLNRKVNYKQREKEKDGKNKERPGTLYWNGPSSAYYSKSLQFTGHHFIKLCLLALYVWYTVGIFTYNIQRASTGNRKCFFHFGKVIFKVNFCTIVKEHICMLLNCSGSH